MVQKSKLSSSPATTIKASMKFLFPAICALTWGGMAGCHNAALNKDQAGAQALNAADGTHGSSTVVHQTETLIVRKLSDHVYQHVSYLNTNDFGKVDCNGMVVVNKQEAVIFDTPADEESSDELIQYVTKELRCKIKAIIPTHFHGDCVGGLEKFFDHNIHAIASNKTITLLKNNNENFSRQLEGFDDSLSLDLAGKKVYAFYFGEGHTKDNIVGYFPADNAIFGGCLIKALDATKGYLGDANVDAWSATVRRIKDRFPNAGIVIPGHGPFGSSTLLDYTIKLFE